MNAWDELLGADNSDILNWAREQTWASAMAECAQDPVWHAEGDVWAHTEMVFSEVGRLAEYPALPRVDQVKLLLAALFHDAGKPATTARDPGTGRLRSPRHSVVGSRICRRALQDLGVEHLTREAIVGLVRYHGRPPYLMEQADPVRSVVDLSWLVDNRLLHLFALADFRGRETPEPTRDEEDLNLWKLAAEEAACYGRPFPFANDHARFLNYRGKLSDLNYEPYEDFSCIALLLCGLPGAGKDFWLTQNRAGLPVVALDEIRTELGVQPEGNQGRVAQAAKERCREHLRAGHDFALNATNTVRNTRRRWIDLFAGYGARVEVVFLEPPLQRVLEQNRERASPVPERIILELADNLQPADWTEAHGLVVVEG